MRFTQRTVLAAFTRQRSRKVGYGADCARCCENVGPTFNPYHVPRVPLQKGGTRKTENCIILCNKCFSEIGFDHPEIISLDELPCYRA